MQRDNLGKWAMAVAFLMILVAAVLVVSSILNHKVPVSLGGQVINARVANTDDSRVKGLSGSSQLADNEAMLFIFDTSGRWSIWMKDMNYSLDIIWLNDAKQIIYMQQNVSPNTYPKVFLPSSDARYVIELPAGFLQRHGVSLGQTAGFSAN